MNENRKGKIYGIIFLILILFLIIGGYFLTKSLTSHDASKEPMESQNEKKGATEELKLDQEKDFIYFENIDILSEKQKIIYQDVKMNFDIPELLELETELNKKTIALKETVKKISEANLSIEEQEKIVFQDDDIYEANYLKYTRYFSEKYASLIVDEYLFNCINGGSYQNSTAYVIDLETGHLLTSDELMSRFDFTFANIKNRVKEDLEKMLEEDETILIDETLSNLDNRENYALYINKSGYFVISYIVKSSKVDYNDVIILN